MAKAKQTTYHVVDRTNITDGVDVVLCMADELPCKYPFCTAMWMTDGARGLHYFTNKTTALASFEQRAKN